MAVAGAAAAVAVVSKKVAATVVVVAVEVATAAAATEAVVTIKITKESCKYFLKILFMSHGKGFLLNTSESMNLIYFWCYGKSN